MNLKEKPLVLNLIILYLILFLVYNLYSLVTKNAPAVGLLIIFGIYGLVEMKKEWVWITIFLLVVFELYYSYYLWTIDFFNLIGITLLILNLFVIGWLYKNISLFRNFETNQEFVERIFGGKDEWIKLGLTGLGIFIVILLMTFTKIYTYAAQVLLGLLLWIVFVWIILPLIIRK